MELSFSTHHRSFLPQITPAIKSQFLLKAPTNSLQLRSIISFRRLSSRSFPMPSRRPHFFSIARASRGEAEISGRIEGRILVGSAITVVLAVANRVLYKLALVPMRNYPFFLAQVTTFGYVAVYFSILYLRYRAGIVTKEMMAIPKSRFMAIGLLEALGVASGMSAGAMLPGPAIPILSQAFLVWQLIFSILILGRKYSLNQIFGCMLVTSGVILAVASGASEGQFLSEVEFLWPALMVASSAFQAGASILKEFVFIDAVKRLQGKPLDIFVVNSFGSGFQALFVFLLLPLLSNLKGIPFFELLAYLKAGAACFLNVTGNTTVKTLHFLTQFVQCGSELFDSVYSHESRLVPGCEGAPLLPVLFIMMNMAFNISLLNLVKMSSAVVASLAVTLAVPLSIYILSLPLPYIPKSTSLNGFFVIGTTILVLGLMLYNLPRSTNQLPKDD